MEQYEVSEAMVDLPRIVEEVERGGAVALMGEKGRVVAVVMPVVAYYEYCRLKAEDAGAWKHPERDFWDAVQEFRGKYTAEELEELNVEEIYRDVRERSPDFQGIVIEDWTL